MKKAEKGGRSTSTLTLAVDCALRWLNLGLADEEKVYGEFCINSGAKQSESLPLLVDHFLSAHGCCLGDLDRIAVTAGPGYYTGIRVGLSYATALAESLGIDIVAVPTLYALAYDLALSGLPIAPVVRARKGAIYAAVYCRQNDGSVVAALPPAFYETGEFIHILRHSPEKLSPVLVGSDILTFDELNGSSFPVIPRPYAIGLNTALAAMTLAPGDPAAIRALYLREPD